MYLEKPLLVRSSSRRNRRRGTGPSKGSAIIVVLALVAVNYFLFFGEDDVAEPPTLAERLNKTASEQAATRGDASAQTSGAVVTPASGIAPAPVGEANQALAAVSDAKPEADLEETDDFGEPIGRKIEGKLRKGHTVIKSLNKEGIDSKTAMPLIHAMKTVFDFRHAQVGDRFKAWVDDEGQVRRFTYRQSPLDIYIVDLQEDGSYLARKKAVPTRVEVAKLGCAIKSSLYESMKRCGESPLLASQFVDLFAWDVDFFQDVRKGDTFKVLVEKISVNGKFLKYGKVIAAEYSGKFGQHRMVHYRNPEGQEGYFTPEGRGVKKEFLKSPLKYTRVSAGKTTGIRASLKKSAPVVYTAQRNTPVWAVSSGTVVFAGMSGSLGRTVTIKHDNGYTSTYGHLKKLPKGIKVGRLVKQKTVIGYVGSSGDAKEPQLLFSLRKKGRLVNPLRMNAAEANPIEAEHREHFDKEVEAILEDLEATPIQGRDHKKS